MKLERNIKKTTNITTADMKLSMSDFQCFFYKNIKQFLRKYCINTVQSLINFERLLNMHI